MKIHPNYEMNALFNSGKAKIIDYKFLPYRYLNINKSAFEDLVYDSGIGADSTIPAAWLSAEILPLTMKGIQTEQNGQVVVPTAAVTAALPDLAPEDLSEPALPEPATVESVAALPEPATVAEPVTAEPGPATVVESVAAEPGPATVVESVAAEPEPTTVVEAVAAEPESATVAEPVAAEPEPVTAITPEAALQVPVSDVGATNTPAAAKTGITTKVIQPESAPGGLIAEIYFEGDPSAVILGATPGFFSGDPAIIPAPYTDDGLMEENPLYPPYISFISFNRLGLTMRNLTNLLDSDEDFELNIIDCNSKDNSWDYIQSLNDRRIKSRIRFDKNCGPIFATNFSLSRRKPFQYFIAMDSDTFIKTKNWIARFMEVFNAFPQVGLLGLMRDNPYPRYLPPIIPRINGAISYLELMNADIDASMDFIPGQLQCLRPKLIKEIGYWSEENGFGDAEISPRIVHYTNFTVGFITTIEIDMTQRITCEECMGKHFCTLSRSISDCFMLSRQYNKNESFVDKNTWKFRQSFQELREGQRTAYCASIHDPESMRTHKYNQDWAFDNFNHYIINAN